MPERTADVVHAIRSLAPTVQIILSTCDAGKKPSRLMMQQLSIQGYHDEGDGAERLLMAVDTALKAFEHTNSMEKHRVGLQYILDIAPDLHRLQPLDELLQGILWQIEALLVGDRVRGCGGLKRAQPGQRRDRLASSAPTDFPGT
jgi:two-component system, cell cycle response regulator